MAPADLLFRRQRLEFAVQPAKLLEFVDLTGMHVQQCRGVGTTGAHQVVLVAVVGEHQSAHLVGHRGQQRTALARINPRCVDQGVHQDLDVHLMVRAVDAGGIVQRVGIDPTAAEVELDTTQRCHAEVATLPDHLGSQLIPVDPDGVIGAVAHRGIGLRLGLDVGSDAPVEQQVHRSTQDGADALGRRQLGHVVIDTEHHTHLFGDRDRLLLPAEDTAAGADQTRVVVLPTRARQVEESPPLGERSRRVRVGVDEDVAMVEGRDQSDVL